MIIIKKLLWLSDSPTTTTGFATITRNILNLLKDDYECHCVGHNHFGLTLRPPVYFTDGEKIDFYLHGQGRKRYCTDTLTERIRKLNIDIFGGLLDTFMLLEDGFLEVDTSPARTFWYYPSDGGGGLPRGCENILRKIELPIAMSRFARDQVKKIYGIKSEYIPHAFDPNLFYPLPKEEIEKIKASKWLLRNKFIVGTVARNQGRKMIDRMIKSFAIFCKDKPDAIMLMHCDPNDAAQIFFLPNLINRYKINNRVLFTGASFLNPFTYKQMNEIYNIMDVFLLPTSGEGFGIPIIEAMACGIPQLITDYTTTRELVEEDGKSGESILLADEKELVPNPHTDEVLSGTLTGTYDVERGIMSVYDGVEKLNKLYYDKELREKYKKVSIEKANKFYTWEIIINGKNGWKNTLKKLL